MTSYKLPNGWRWVTLADICLIERGISFPRSAMSDTREEGYLACLRTSNVQDYVNWDDLIYIPESYVKFPQKLVQTDDILISTANSRPLVGKVSFVQELPTKTTFGGFISVIRASNVIDPYFLFAYLGSDVSQAKLSDISFQTTNIANLSIRELSRFPVPLPTLPEQREIVKILRQADHLRQLRTQADKLSERLLLSIFNEMFQKPKSNWIRCKLGDVISLEAGKNFAAKPEPAQKDKWGILKVSAVTYGTFLPQENKELPEDMVPNLDYQVKQGDLLITRANTAELVGASAIVRSISQDLLLPDKIWRAVFDGKYPSNSYFLYGLLNSAPIRKEISRRATGTSGSMKNISQSSFLDMIIRIPPADEQDKFAEIVQSIWQNVHDPQAEVESSLAQLMQSVQGNAFVGTLTESYRNKYDVELARLAQEREQLWGEATITSTSEISLVTENRTKIRSELSFSQQMIVTLIEEHGGYSMANSLLTQSQLPVNQIQRNLDLLTQLGLMKAVKISVAPGELGRVLFTHAYRPLQPEDDVRDIDLAILREAQEE